MLLYAVTIFLGAFLLFQVQPILAKMILPWFGGSGAVWTTSMLFFQTVLPLGYLYAHWSVERLPAKRQALVHIALLLASLAFLPVVPADWWKPSGGENPTVRILALLAATVGLPYFLLSTTGPLLQAWYSSAHSGTSPYRLYALSNSASLLALFSYPILVEPSFGTRRQGWVWSAAYALFTGLCAWTALRDAGHRTKAPPRPAAAPVEPGLKLMWVALPACASALMLAVTNHLCHNVAAIPFLWILPLSLYLLTFIICFEHENWYRRGWLMPLLAMALGLMAYALHPGLENSSILRLIPLFSGGLFVCSMFCHGELVRLKPHPSHLTSFYLMVALGGALGGAFVGVMAPAVFRGYYELPAALVACAILVLAVLYRDPRSRFNRRPFHPAWLSLAVLCLTLAVTLACQVSEARRGARVTLRSFYGRLQVVDEGEPNSPWFMRKLKHGTITHGLQYLHPQRIRLPTAYYGPRSGGGLAILNANRDLPQRIGLIGLGAGVMAAYGRAGDLYRFYEINPQVVKLARSQFTYLTQSPAKVEVKLGDARLSLEREANQEFDVLVVDAFASDSIPVHLLTVEAIELYFRHLKRDGVLALHISNRYLDLEPVLERAARQMGKAALLVEHQPPKPAIVSNSTWVLLANRKEVFDQPAYKKAGSPPEPQAGLRTWTDDYSNLFQALK